MAILTKIRKKMGQDPMELAPNIYTTIMDNNRVRVLSIRLGPRESTPMHWHPDYIIYALNDCQVRFTYPDGTTNEARISAGDCVWRDSEVHSAENIGSTDLQVLNIELKK